MSLLADDSLSSVRMRTAAWCALIRPVKLGGAFPCCAFDIVLFSENLISERESEELFPPKCKSRVSELYY